MAERTQPAGIPEGSGDLTGIAPVDLTGRTAVAGESASDRAPLQEPPKAPVAAASIFGPRLELAVRFAAHLADTGISHGLIGPREVPRLWDRHILNCAVIAEVMPEETTVVDVGSGAGLPGIAVALARPDLSVTLVDPMERRTAWLTMVVEDLGLANVAVRRARAEELHGDLQAEVVTARAVAAMDKLARWCLPLVAPGGRLVAMKGSSAEREIAAAAKTLQRLGASGTSIRTCGEGILETPTTVVVVEVSTTQPPRRQRSGRSPRRHR